MTFSNPIVGGTTLIRPAIQSPNYSAGVAGWSINKDGTAEFNNVVIRGTNVIDAVVVGPSNGPEVKVGSNANAGYIKFPTNRPIERQIATILAGVLNQGFVNESSSLQITGPSVSGATDNCHLYLNSQNNDGSSNANVNLVAGTGAIILDKTSATVQGSRLFVSPSASALNALSVQTAAGHTGNAFRVANSAGDLTKVDNSGVMTHASDINVGGNVGVTGSVTSGGAIVNGNANVTGNLTAGNIQTGSFTITPTVASQWTNNLAVTFNVPFSYVPVVVVTPTNGGPGTGTTTILEFQVTGITTTGFNCRILRGNLSATTLSYIAT